MPSFLYHMCYFLGTFECWKHKSAFLLSNAMFMNNKNYYFENFIPKNILYIHKWRIAKGTFKILCDCHLILILEVEDWLDSITYANGIFYSLEIDKSLMEEKAEIWWQFTACVFYRLPDAVYLTWKLEVLWAWSLEK